jgi:hypothetical protein
MHRVHATSSSLSPRHWRSSSRFVATLGCVCAAARGRCAGGRPALEPAEEASELETSTTARDSGTCEEQRMLASASRGRDELPEARTKHSRRFAQRLASAPQIPRKLLRPFCTARRLSGCPVLRHGRVSSAISTQNVHGPAPSDASKHCCQLLLADLPAGQPKALADLRGRASGRLGCATARGGRASWQADAPPPPSAVLAAAPWPP